MTTAPRPASALVHGTAGPVVIVSGRVAAFLGRYAGLDDFRVQNRGRDAEVDETLVALRLVAMAWRETRGVGSVDTTVRPTPPQPVGESSQGLTTAQAAARLGVGAEAVRKAIREERLPAQQIDGRWRITPEAVEHFKAARAA
ncbi:helix-turn-helix domain-containing protein [Curtobacterium sp. MCPF17_050]|uniref:helix-turn-helix domain-containing protein n=1 Tax=Curtobacterium sp. MCPF17_050 TaxID=2175664 RepID=UPI000D94C2AE|nr:helix-turn-helix domain-containing protein [Curtobacterium sp. MCPF17_050]WIB16278.1 helix-turn-helix domain-containing protein [Curtobacterium sp. MCPF17_050]